MTYSIDHYTLLGGIGIALTGIGVAVIYLLSRLATKPLSSYQDEIGELHERKEYARAGDDRDK